MNTDRIQIINQDQSTSMPTEDVGVVGYTVLEAGKGPIEPVYIPPNSPGMIYDVVGYTCEEFPTIQEALDFNNRGYGLYISAPYDKSADNKVPVAYMTPAGVLTRKDPVNITGHRLEAVANDEAIIPGINQIESNQTVLVPVGTAKSLFDVGQDVANENILDYESGDNKELFIDVGLDLNRTDGETADLASSYFQPLNNSAFDVAHPERILRNSETGDVAGVLVFDIPGEDLLEVEIVTDGSNLALRDGEGRALGEVTSDGDGKILRLVLDSQQSRGDLTGAYQAYFSRTAIATVWADLEFRRSVRVYWKAQLNEDAIYGTIYPKYLSERKTSLSFPKQKLGNKLSFSVNEQVIPNSFSTRTITGSLRAEDKDGFGSPLGFKERLSNQHLIDIAVIKEFNTDTIFPNTDSKVSREIIMRSVELQRGSRSVDSLEQGWVEAKDPNFSHVDIFFNPVPLTEVETEFTTIADTHELSRCIGSRLISPDNVEDLTPASYGANYFITTNAFVRRSSFTRAEFLSPLTGAYAGMIARIIDRRYGGAAPMFVNQGDVGGQLNISVLRPLFRYTREQLTRLDETNYNPIIRDAAYGVMVTSQKTCQPGEMSDWSFIGHASAFLLFQKEVRRSVMIPQLGKPNNPSFRELRASQTETLLRPRLEGQSRIWAGALVDTESVNTDDVLQQRKFYIKVVVKVDIFSEGVTLIFENLPQTASI